MRKLFLKLPHEYETQYDCNVDAFITAYFNSDFGDSYGVFLDNAKSFWENYFNIPSPRYEYDPDKSIKEASYRANTIFLPEILLTGKIEKADKIMEDVVFDADNLDSAVTDIELAADNLTSEQNYKNQQSDSLTIEINSLTQKTEKLSKETIEQTTYAIKLNLNARLDATMTNSEYIQDLVEDGVINEDVAEAISDTMQSQASADKMVAPKLDANAVAPCNAMNVAEQLEDCAAEINEAVQEARRERNPDWDSDEEDDDEDNRSN